MTQSGIERWLDRGWKIVQNQEQPLGNLQGRSVGRTTLLVLSGPRNKAGAFYFQVFLRDSHGEVSQDPALLGLHHSGPHPGYNWVEVIDLAEEVAFPSGDRYRLEVAEGELGYELLRYLADLIPPGGHLMIEYDSPRHGETATALEAGVPPVATPLGYLMFTIGCGAAFKDWFFAEGASEGPRKLQGYRALNEEHARAKAGEMARELESFLAMPLSGVNLKVKEDARRRAQEVLKRLGGTRNARRRRKNG